MIRASLFVIVLRTVVTGCSETSYSYRNINYSCAHSSKRCAFDMYLRVNIDYLPKYHYPAGVCNQDAVCFLSCRNSISRFEILSANQL
jgi:hypothetical protein